MFERFGDLPLHVLVIHLAVVQLPTAALIAIVFAIVPRYRRLLRWPTLLLGIGSAVVAFVAKDSGQAFVAAKPALAQLVREHEQRGDLLFWYSIGFAFITILGALWLTGPSTLASGRGARTGAAWTGGRGARTGDRHPVELVSAGLVVVSLHEVFAPFGIAYQPTDVPG